MRSITNLPTHYLSTMADRKVLVNYIHPDIDLLHYQKAKKPKTAKDGKDN